MDINDCKEFGEWLERNQEQLKVRSLEEIRDLAIACGFSRITVSQWQIGQNFKAASNG